MVIFNQHIKIVSQYNNLQVVFLLPKKEPKVYMKGTSFKIVQTVCMTMDDTNMKVSKVFEL